MAKNYKETTTQAAVLRTSTKTLSFWCNIREAPLERFAELRILAAERAISLNSHILTLKFLIFMKLKIVCKQKNPFSPRKSMANTQKQVVSSTECASPSILRCSTQKKLKMEN